MVCKRIWLGDFFKLLYTDTARNCLIAKGNIAKVYMVFKPFSSTVEQFSRGSLLNNIINDKGVGGRL